jgi:O-succinylbenzoic acid--CoA ligase
VGLLEIIGPVVGTGYRDGRNADSWFRGAGGQPGFRTSDLGWVGASGEVVISGRADDVVQVGGVNVATSAVAAALGEQPGVREAVVVAAPDPQWGARLVAFVVTDSADGAFVPELRERVRTALGRPAVPADIRLRTDLPLLPGGKPDRAALTRMAQDGGAAVR